MKSALAQCPTAQFYVCDDSGGNGVMRFYFYAGSVSGGTTYLLFDIVNSKYVTSPLGPVTVTTLTTLPPGAVAGIELDFIPNSTYVLRANNSSCTGGFQVYGGAGITVNSSNALAATTSILSPDCNIVSPNGQLSITVSNGTPGYTVNWNAGNPTAIPQGNLSSSPYTQISANNLLGGTYSASVVDNNFVLDGIGCTLAVNNIIVPSPPTVSAGPNQSICTGQTASLSGTIGGSATGGTWSTSGTGTFSPSTTTLNATYTPGLGETNATLTLTTSGGACAPTSASMVLTVNPLPVAAISYAGSPFCATGTVNVTQTGQGGGTYSSTAGLSINSSTGQINLATSTAGTYTVTYSFTNGTCPNTTTTSVTINALPVATISYAGSPFCATGTVNVTQTGQGGGTYSSTAGLSINSSTGQINLATSTAGTYTVTYSFTNGTCPNTTTTSVTINALPVATISYAGSPFCATGTVNVTQTGQGGGTYSSTAGLSINSSTGQINLATSTAGTYTVTYSFISGTCPNTTTTSVTINALPVATISYAGSPFCATGTVNVTQTGQGGGTYSSTAGLSINSSTGQINLATSTAGTYTVTYSFTNGTCPNTTTTSVTINALPVATISYAGSPFCATGTVNVTQTGQGGGTYSSTAGLSINSSTGQINLATSTAGTYTVTYSFTDGTCPNTTTTNVSITTVPSVVISYSGSPFCQSVATSQPVTQSGGTGAYTGGTYSASPLGLSIDGVTGSIIPSTSTVGTYTVTYTIPASGGCSTVMETTTVVINSVPTVVITNPAAVCNPSTVDLTAASVTAGSTPGLTFTYWTDAAATLALATPNAVASSGTYYIQGTSPTGCSDIKPVTVTINLGPSSAVLSGDNTICSSSSTNLIVTITGGVSPYNFTINNGVGLQSGYVSGNPISVSPSSNMVYSIVGNVTDANGCSVAGTGTATINVNAPATPTLSGPANACMGTSVNYATDTGMSNYNWVLSAGGSITNNNGDNVDVTWNTAGVQTVSVNYTDTNGCTATTTVLNVNVANLVVTPTITDNTNCAPSYNGAINLAVSGSVGVLTYAWTSVGGFTSSSQNISNLAPDNYSLTVTDPVSGCVVTYSGLIVNDNPPTISISLTASTDNDKCVAPFDGSLTISTSGSVGSPSFSWAGTGGYTSSSQNIANLNSGTYTVTVTDPTSGCSANQPFTVNDITPTIIPSTNPTDNTNCVAPYNGSITSSVSGGGPGYTYQWSGPSAFTATTQNISALAAGSYDLTVTDVVTGCTGTLVGTVINNSPPTITVTSVSTTNATCLGVNNGLIQVNGVSGGAAPYQYSIDNGTTFQPSNTFSSVAPGSYQVVAKDNGGCTSAAYAATINAGVSITAATSSTNATCVGTTDGSITVTSVTGGTSPYTYSDDNGVTFQSSNTFLNLASGNYQIIVQDNNGCQSAATSVSVGTNTTITFTATPTNASCAGINDGQIVVTAPTGGVAPYTYSDDNGATYQASSTFSSLAAGSYNIVIKDANGCLSAASATSVGSNTVITITTVNHTDATCSGLNDGTITVATVTGGASPYTYSTDNGVTFQTGNSFSNLAPNTYQVVVKDNNGCTSSASAVIVGSGSTITIATSKIDATCGGNSDGSITITSVVGGNPGYSYSSDGGTTYQTSNVLASLAANVYSVVVKDISGCLSNTVSVTINNSVSIIPNYTKTDASCAANDGSVVVNSVSGGSSPYMYSINNGVTYQASGTFTNLAVATYNLIVKDNNGCLSTPVAIVVSKPGSCGGTNCGAFTILATDTRPTCNNQNNGTITINVSGGTPNYIVTLSDPSISFNQAMSGAGPFTFVNLSPSLTYQYTVQDASGNTCTLPYSLPINSTVQATAGSFVDAQCFGQPVGQATVTVSSGGTSPYSYSLDNGTTWVSFTSPVVITNLMPASAPYSILVADDPSDPCPAQVMVTINNANPAIAMTAPTVNNASCANNDGSIQVGTISGGVAPYTYRFDSVGYASLPAGNTFSALSSGTHKFTVIDAISCSRTFTLSVGSPGYVNFFTQRINPSCTGNGNDGKVKVTILSSGNFDIGITPDLVNPPTTFKFTNISNLSTPVTFDSLLQGQYHIEVKPNGAFCSTDSIITINGGPKAVAFSFTPNNFVCFEKKGTLNLFNITGAPAVNYNYILTDTLGTTVVQQGTIGAGLTSGIVNGLANGNYKIWLYQKQAVCVDSIPSAKKKFTIVGPTQTSFDTLSVKRTLSELNTATGSMTITLQNTFAPGYRLNLKMLSAFVPNENNSHNVFDSTWVKLDSTLVPVVFVASDLYAGNYRLSIRDKFGCTRVDTLSINVSTKIFIPNVFTPNNDGKNDAFEILNLPPNSSITISNRWGKQVFSGSNFIATVLPDGVTSTHIWNGGSESDGIYYYTLSAGGKTYTGWVELLHPTY
jgi:hypothetical protein